MVAISERQASLEEAARKIDLAGIDTRKRPVDLFGRMEDWSMTFGPVHLVLVPSVNQWWYYHEGHERWEYTGYHAGEVVFFFEKGTLNPPPKGYTRITQARERAVTAHCPSCGSPTVPGKKFCINCGADTSPPPEVRSPPAFCTGCGAPLTPGRAFCVSCGRKL